VCQLGACGQSGGLNEPLFPSATQCTQPFTANLDGGVCQACGGANQPCCVNEISTIFFLTCGEGYACQGGSCWDGGCTNGLCQ
jgi:hypothetical protein